jgi:hypothetical protein
MRGKLAPMAAKGEAPATEASPRVTREVDEFTESRKDSTTTAHLTRLPPTVTCQVEHSHTECGLDCPLWALNIRHLKPHSLR